MLRFLVVLAAVLAAGNAAASSLLVLADGSGPYPDLQTALVAAADGDTVLLGDGVFVGEGNRNLVVADRTLSFRSQSGDATTCVVDLEFTPSATRRFLDCSGGTVVVEDLTVEDGGAYGDGGCVRGTGLDLVIRRCRLQNSQCWSHFIRGGAIGQIGGSLLLEDCTLVGNSAHGGPGESGSGGAVSTEAASVSLVRSTFAANVAAGSFDNGGTGGGVRCIGGVLLVEDCVFTGNLVGGSAAGLSLGGAVAVFNGQAEVRGSVFAGNEAMASSHGGAFALYVYEGQGQALLTNCTFAGNVAGIGGGTVYAGGAALNLDACIITGAGERGWEPGEVVPGVAAAVYEATITATDSDVWGNGENWAGPLSGQDGHDGNFSANPCFCDTTAGDFHLCADSWCAAENNVAHPGVLVGALPVGCEACDCDDGPVAVADVTPAALHLLGATPNPFNPATEIRFALRAPGMTRLTVHDLAGRLVATLVDGPCAMGAQSVTWQPGRALAGGIYLLRLASGGAVVTDRLTLLK